MYDFMQEVKILMRQLTESFVKGGSNGMGCFVRVAKVAWDVLSRVAEMTWDVLSGQANLCWMFCQGCQKKGMGCFVPGCFVLHSFLDGKIFEQESPSCIQPDRK